jgi:hypothetical protein
MRMAAFAAAIPAHPRARFSVARLVRPDAPTVSLSILSAQRAGTTSAWLPPGPGCRRVALVGSATASMTQARTRSVAANPDIKNSG